MSTISLVLDQLSIEVSSVGGQEIEAHCPFHPDNHPSFYINETTGLWICFQCQRSGTLNQLISDLDGENKISKAALREIAYKSVKKKRKEKVEPASKVEEIDPILLEARFESYREPPDWALEERFISRQASRHHNLRWDKGWLLPMRSPTNQLIGWQFKRLEVVLNYPNAMKKSSTLFGLTECITDKHVVLVESPLDVVRLTTKSVPAVASCGALVSKVQLDLLVSIFGKVYLALDNDKVGQEQTQKIYPYLAKRVHTTRVKLPLGVKDPGDATDEQIEQVFESAVIE